MAAAPISFSSYCFSNSILIFKSLSTKVRHALATLAFAWAAAAAEAAVDALFEDWEWCEACYLTDKMGCLPSLKRERSGSCLAGDEVEGASLK